MQIKHIEINNFRGIKNLNWRIESNFVCLVGPGDSTKSTILDAIELTLSPRWNLLFNDNDFFNTQTSDPVQIIITLVSLPESLLLDSKFGLYLSGWNSGLGFQEEPQENDEKALKIRLKVDSSLEPEGTVINSRTQEGVKISAIDREKLSVARLGVFVDRHLSWGKGTILSRMTEETDEISTMLSDMSRAAKESISLDKLPKLSEVADKVQNLGIKFGVSSKGSYSPQIDIQSMGTTISNFTLHDESVPLRLSGLGTKRLISIAMQHNNALKKGGITLVDELEHGLEPHRIRKLLLELHPERDLSQTTSIEQVFITTHSPIVITELSASSLHIVRAELGQVSVIQVDPELQSLIRTSPDIFLGKYALVCEGKTEFGICKIVDEEISKTHPGESFAYKGIVPVLGEGTKCIETTKHLSQLGYSPVLFCDSDNPDINSKISELKDLGVIVIQWEDLLCIEEVIAKDLPWDYLLQVIQLAIDIRGEQSILDKINSHLLEAGHSKISDLKVLAESEYLRSSIGKAASGKKIGNSKASEGWFKRVDHGEDLGKLILSCFEKIKDKDLGIKLQSLREWINQCD